MVNHALMHQPLCRANKGCVRCARGSVRVELHLTGPQLDQHLGKDQTDSPALAVSANQYGLPPVELVHVPVNKLVSLPGGVVKTAMYLALTLFKGYLRGLCIL